AGHDGSLMARGAAVAAMRERGLLIESAAHGNIHVPKVRATDDPGDIGPVDFVIMSVKLLDTEAAIRQMRPMLRTGTTVLSLQNGVIKDDILRPDLGDAPVIGGVCCSPPTLPPPGLIRPTV